MMRHQQHIGGRPLPLSQQPALDVVINVARQQHASGVRCHQQHAGTVVFHVGQISPWMQHGEIHAIPAPMLATGTRPTKLMVTAVNRGVRPVLSQRVQPAGMIQIAVADDNALRLQLPGLRQCRHDVSNAITTGIVAGTTVIHQHMPGGAQQHRSALPHIHHLGLPGPLWQLWAQRPQYRQPQTQRQPAQRHATWQHQPEATQHGQQQQPV